MWGLEKLTIYNKPNKREKRKVGKFTLDNILVKEYESATQAANENGTSIWKVLAGTNQTHKQHIYKYLDS
jgi:phosphoribosylaminoimidazole carboxylase (NCAIR synthetase)